MRPRRAGRRQSRTWPTTAWRGRRPTARPEASTLDARLGDGHALRGSDDAAGHAQPLVGDRVAQRVAAARGIDRTGIDRDGVTRNSSTTLPGERKPGRACWAPMWRRRRWLARSAADRSTSGGMNSTMTVSTPRSPNRGPGDLVNRPVALGCQVDRLTPDGRCRPTPARSPGELGEHQAGCTARTGREGSPAAGIGEDGDPPSRWRRRLIRQHQRGVEHLPHRGPG